MCELIPHKGCAQLKRWPSAIEKALSSVKMLNNGTNYCISGSPMTAGEGNVTTSLMKSVMALKTQTQGEKIMCNIHTACMEIATLIRVSSIGWVMLVLFIVLYRGIGILQSKWRILCWASSHHTVF